MLKIGWRSIAAEAVTFAVLAVLIVDRVPLSANALLDVAIAMHTEEPGARMLHVFSGVQGRPTETCDTFEARHAGVVAAIQAEASTAGDAGWLSGTLTTLGAIDERVRGLFLTRPDESCWKEFADYAYFQGGFPADARYIWAIGRLGLSTAHVALALIVGAWAGLLCLFLIARRLSGSSLVGLATVSLNAAIWRWWDFPVGNSLFVLNCFVPLYLAMRLATPPQEGRLTGAKLIAAEIALIACFVPSAFLQGFFSPFTHRVNGTLAIIAILTVGLLQMNRRVLARGAAVLIAVTLLNVPFYRDVNGLYAQLTTQNLAANGGFIEGQMAQSLYERPTYLGLPNGDYGFTWMHAIDPYLYYTAPHLVIHQAFRYFGSTILGDVLLTHPLTLASAVYRRVFIQIGYHHEMYFWWYRPTGTSAQIKYGAVAAAFVAFVVTCAWSLARGHRWSVLWPLALFIGWHTFGVNTIMTIVHTHEKYVFSGVLLLLTLAPAMAVFVFRDTRRERREPRPAPAVLRQLRDWWPYRPRITAAAAAAAVLALSPVLVAEARKEIDVFWLWFPLHAVTHPDPIFDRELWRSPQELRSRVDRLQLKGESEPGATEMYAAWLFWVYNNQNAINRRGPARHDAAMQERLKTEAQSLMEDAYRAALKAAPDNPNFASYALMINVPEWPEIFRRAITGWPRHHHAPYMAYHMIFQGKTSSPEERTRFIQVYEDGVGRTLASSAADRPGYQFRPRAARLSPDAAAAAKATVIRGEISLQTGESLLLDPIAVRGAPKMRVGLYVYVPQGQVQTMAVDAAGNVIASCSQFTSSHFDAQHYRYVECAAIDRIESLHLRITAAQPTRLVIRDYYPLFSVVRTAPLN